MKSIVILYENNSKYATKKSFGSLSGKELCEKNINKLGIEVAKIMPCNTVFELLSTMSNKAKENKADYVIFSYDDLPFFNVELTKKMIHSHEEFKAEYTYADGYPYGLSPEIIDTGALEILQQLASSTQKTLGEKPVTRDCIFELLKPEINSFEVESVLADNDWRLLRLAFHCGKKDNYLSSLALYNNVEKADELSADELSEKASVIPEVLKTVPGFYNIQIADYVSNNSIYTPYNKAYEEKNKISPMEVNNVMSYEDFSLLIDKIADFSDTAVVSLSAWGEPFAHKDILKMVEKVLSYEGLSVFIETDGLNITDELCQKLGQIVNNAKKRTNGWDKLMIAVVLDAVSSSKYMELHNNSSNNDFEKAVTAIKKLNDNIPDCVYPQFTRINENEDELENFFRYWNNKESPTKGKFIIQKYDDFAGELPKRKPADLSPLERNVCWHLRRDLTILSTGEVPFCRAYVLSNIIGNAFKEPLDEIWGKLNKTLKEHLNNNYINKCGKCDEYYTFNF